MNLQVQTYICMYKFIIDLSIFTQGKTTDTAGLSVQTQLPIIFKQAILIYFLNLPNFLIKQSTECYC